MSRSRLATYSAVALALALTAPAIDAQQLTRSGMRARPAVITQEDILDAAARGDGHVQSGEFAAARQAFREASVLQLRVRELPEGALRQVAATYYAENSPERAAQVLDELASVAASHGDVNVQARALIDAAFLYRTAGQWQRPREISRELRLLSQGDALDAELKAVIAQRIGK